MLQAERLGCLYAKQPSDPHHEHIELVSALQVGCTTSGTARPSAAHNNGVASTFASVSSSAPLARSNQSQPKVGAKSVANVGESAPPTVSRSSQPGRELVVTTKNAWDLLMEDEIGSDDSASDNEVPKSTSGDHCVVILLPHQIGRIFAKDICPVVVHA